MTQTKIKKVIGRAERISLPEVGIPAVHSRIDSGARTSAIWVSYAEIEDGALAVIFFDKNEPAYTGQKYYYHSFARDIVISSTGHRQRRYKIKLLVVLKNRKIRASFTLADRSTQVYPVLIGRNVLRGKFVVDVEHGKTLATKEKELRLKKQEELKQYEETA